MKRMLGLARKAIQDYDMIAPGDKIAVGVSGGKDSLTLLMTLAKLREFYPVPFDLVAITLDMCAEGGERSPGDFTQIRAFCEKLGVPYVVVPTNITHVVFDLRKEKNPCSLCAKLRRGALNRAAAENGCSKVALGHHLDDAVETFAMNLMHGSRLACFEPVTELSRTGLTVIRPLIYVTEGEIKSFARRFSLPIAKNPCPADGNTEREHTKQLLRSLDKDCRGIKLRIFNAIRSSHIDGW
jgi:tRNA 2-thiocytidine biosynthesis protein TtcA